jgi:GntR family transcriptional regulator
MQISPELFNVAIGSAEPIYRQLVALVRRRVAAGQFGAGDEMPSVRDLAQALALNPMTVSKAFSILETVGILQRRRGMTMVIASAPARPDADAAALLRPALQRAAREAFELGLTREQALRLFAAVLDAFSKERT